MTIFLAIMLILVLATIGTVKITGPNDRTRAIMAVAFYSAFTIVATALVLGLVVLSRGWP